MNKETISWEALSQKRRAIQACEEDYEDKKRSIQQAMDDVGMRYNQLQHILRKEREYLDIWARHFSITYEEIKENYRLLDEVGESSRSDYDKAYNRLESQLGEERKAFQKEHERLEAEWHAARREYELFTDR